MPVFPSREWMHEFCDRLGQHPEAYNVAVALDGTYRFVIQPAGPLPERHAYDVLIAPGPELRLLDEPVEDPTLELSADHERWRQLIQGKLDVRMAVMLRRLKVRGDLSRLIGRLDSTGPLVDALGQVRTEWLDG